MKHVIVRGIQFYQAISRTPALQGIFGWSGCRFWPTCSDYAIASIQQYGVWVGGWRAMVRVAHCNPFTPAFSHTHD